MLVHFVSGVAGGFSNVFFRLSTARAFALAFAVMACYELAEVGFGVREGWANRLLDVVVGMAGFALAIAATAQLGAAGARLAFWLTFATALAGSVAGWIAYRRRD